MSSRAPDRFGVEPIVGYRTWLVRLNGTGLYSVGWRPAEASFWTPDANGRCVARCDHGDAPCHPDDEYTTRRYDGVRRANATFRCRCGFHAWREPTRARVAWKNHAPYWGPGSAPTVSVFGRVSLWGRVIEHELGYRAQYAYPYDLALADYKHRNLVRPRPDLEAVARALQDKYAVEVTIVVV